MAVAVLGLGRFGTQLVQELSDTGIEVLAVDRDRERVNDLAEIAFLAAEGDVNDFEFIQSLALNEYDTVVVAIGSNIAASVLLTLTLKRRLSLPHVVAKASTHDHAVALELAGADIVVSPEQEAAIRLAHTLGSKHVGDYLSLGPSYGVAKIPVPDRLVGRPISHIDLLEKYRVFLLARIRGDSVSFNPNLDELIERNDQWLIAGRDEHLRRLELP